MTRRERIVIEIQTALQGITVLNGYNTDLGNNVVIESEFVDSEPDYIINIFEGDDSIDDELVASSFINLPINISAAKKATNATRWSVKHEIIQDIKKCLLLYRKNKSHDIVNIGYPTVQRIDQESGSGYVATGLTTNIQYHENPNDLEY